ncbi:MAG: hypothetical protein ACYSUV_19695 [Planctomycetota bacterium]
MNRILSCGGMFAALLLVGCAQTQRRETIKQVCLADANQAALMEAAQNTLGEMLFVIDKADAQHGYIRTQPLSGAQSFEFWRSDNAGSFNWAEANLHSVRRTAELNVSQEDDKLYIGCEVRVQRLSLPEQEITSTARAYMMFSKSTSRMQSLELGPGQRKQAGWIDLGRN